MEYLIISYIIVCLPVAFYARSRGGNFLLSLLGSIMFTPIIGAILASFGGTQTVVIKEKK